MPRLIVTIGVPGSGKSTMVAAASCPVVCPDDIRAELTGSAEDQSANNRVFPLVFERLRAHLLDGSDVLLDATNVDPSRRRNLLNIAHECGSTTVVWRVPTPHDVSRTRNRERDRTVPEYVMDRMIKQFDASCSVAQLTSEGWDVVLSADADLVAAQLWDDVPA